MAGSATPTVTPDTGNVWLDSIMWGNQWDSGAAGTSADPTKVSVFIAGMHGNEAVTIGSESVTATTPYFEEIQAMVGAMKAFENVSNIKFQNVGSQANADVIWASVNDTDAEGALGWANPPGTAYNSTVGDYQSLVVSNYEAYNPDFPDANLLVPGGFDYITFIHELGHAVGLAHPHDNGGGSLIAPGVTAPFNSFGTADLNQGVFSMMSYNDGWKTGPLGPSPNATYGFEIGPMAFDIAALQNMYGINKTYHAGNNTYALPTANVAGTGYLCIWDGGGADRIVGGDGGNVIDLRSATLKTEVGGGGWVSYANGIHGGFTIAYGALIEHANGGLGADNIRGNSAANKLLGLDGMDILNGAGGNDILSGGDGSDKLYGSDGEDTLRGGDGNDSLIGGANMDTMTGGLGADDFIFTKLTDSAVGATRDIIKDFTRGSDDIDVGDIDANSLLGGTQHFKLDAGGTFAAGEVKQSVVGDSVILYFNTDNDTAAEMTIEIAGKTKLTVGDFIFV